MFSFYSKCLCFFCILIAKLFPCVLNVLPTEEVRHTFPLLDESAQASLRCLHWSYKDRYRFWPELLRFLLSALFFLFALNDLDKPNMKLMLTAVSSFSVFSLAWVFHGIYRKSPLDTIKASCILNLAVVNNQVLRKQL